MDDRCGEATKRGSWRGKRRKGEAVHRAWNNNTGRVLVQVLVEGSCDSGPAVTPCRCRLATREPAFSRLKLVILRMLPFISLDLVIFISQGTTERQLLN